MLMHKGREFYHALPPLFISGSRHRPYWVLLIQVKIVNFEIPWHDNGCHTVITYLSPFSLKLKDVFIPNFPCASHHPATLCSFH